MAPVLGIWCISVRFQGNRRRAVIHIKQYGIEATATPFEPSAYVRNLDLHSGVVQRMISQVAKRASIPLDHVGNDFHNGDPCVDRQDIQCGAKGKTHT